MDSHSLTAPWRGAERTPNPARQQNNPHAVATASSPSFNSPKHHRHHDHLPSSPTAPTINSFPCTQVRTATSLRPLPANHDDDGSRPPSNTSSLPRVSGAASRASMSSSGSDAHIVSSPSSATGRGLPPSNPPPAHTDGAPPSPNQALPAGEHQHQRPHRDGQQWAPGEPSALATICGGVASRGPACGVHPPPGFVAVRTPAGINVLHAPAAAVRPPSHQPLHASEPAGGGGGDDEPRMCPSCAGTLLCPRGADCPFVHVDPRLVAPPGAHLNLAWQSMDDVSYRCFPADGDAVLSVAAPGSRHIIDAIAPQMLLRTAALEAGRRPLTHCAHYYFNRVCERGASCRFVHAVFVDPTAATLKRAPAPVQMGRPHRDRLRRARVAAGSNSNRPTTHPEDSLTDRGTDHATDRASPSHATNHLEQRERCLRQAPMRPDSSSVATSAAGLQTDSSPFAATDRQLHYCSGGRSQQPPPQPADRGLGDAFGLATRPDDYYPAEGGAGRAHLLPPRDGNATHERVVVYRHSPYGGRAAPTFR